MVRPGLPVSQTVHDLLAATAARRPDESMRFPSQQETVTYRELSARAWSMAGELAAEGVLPGDNVGIRDSALARSRAQAGAPDSAERRDKKTRVESK